jgi:predicted esterase
MRPISSHLRFAAIFVFFFVVAGENRATATEVVLKDGRILLGDFGMTAGLAKRPAPAGQGNLQPIGFIDDGLRRTFFSKRLVRTVNTDRDDAAGNERFKIYQRIPRSGTGIYSVGRIIDAKPFDRFGRRFITFASVAGTIDLIQGITTITPNWVRVEGISHDWDMRMSPASLSTTTLLEIFGSQIGADDLEYQKKIVRFLIQLQRYEEARALLDRLIESTADPEAKKQLQLSRRGLHQLAADRLLGELKKRINVGQHQLARSMLGRFPSEDLSGEILQEVREQLQAYSEADRNREMILKQYNALVDEINDSAVKPKLQEIGREMAAGLNRNTLDRLSAFRLAMNDKDMLPGDRVALAVSGWVVGSGATVTNLSTAISAYTIRQFISEYLAESDPNQRAKILDHLSSQEAASPKMVAAILARIRPPMKAEPVEGQAGFYRLQTYGLSKEKPVNYIVQLPREYDPRRKYPTIVTLHGGGRTAQSQLDWWAGSPNEKGVRAGQAGRWGYIVIAPEWNPTSSGRKYRYSAAETAAVLNSFRDACRRFSIDTDRVFITGHATGANAAWDIALAHPDIWAGLIAFLPRADRYVPLYWENAKLIPTYFVGGEKENRWLVENAHTLDRYLTRGFDATVVEYLGRGFDPLNDETIRAFEWMARFKRDFYPKDFTAVSMRPWDNYFYWLEVDGLPAKAIVHPEDWPPAKGQIPVKSEGKIITANNSIRVQTGARRAWIWFSPKMVDLKQKTPVYFNGRQVNSRDPFVKPNIKTMLEDARTRCDRQNPFWAKLEIEKGKAR